MTKGTYDNGRIRGHKCFLISVCPFRIKGIFCFRLLKNRFFDDPCHRFKSLFVVFIKARKKGAVNIKDTDHFTATVKERNHDLAVGCAVAGDMPREGVHVGDKLCFSFCHGGSANALSNGDLDASGLTLKGVQHKSPLLHQIKACPIEIGKRLKDQCGGVGKVCRSVGDTADQGTEGVAKFLIIGHFLLCASYSTKKARFSFLSGAAGYSVSR